MSNSSKRRAATRASRARQVETGEPYAEARNHATTGNGHHPAGREEQHTADSSMLGSRFRLVPPLSDDFTVYGTPDVVGRARQWALDHQLLLFKGTADSCVHGLYRMDMCAAPDACQKAGLDHTQIWVEHDARSAFLLTQPYVDEVPQTLTTYAWAHGLQVASYPFDGWYGHSTMPIRLTLPNNWPLWPIERDAAVVLHTQPIRWPDSE
jgi:hypothetical protein